MPKRERMSAVDTAWLRMDRPTNLMQIAGILVLETPLDLDRYRLTLEARLAQRFRRFRQRVEQDLTGTWWTDDADFSIDNHISLHRLPQGDAKTHLQQLASRLAVQPLDPRHPLWHFDVVEDYLGGTAIVVRIHHCIADGIALIGVMLSLTDTSAAAPPPTPHRRGGGERHDGSPWAPLLEPLANAATTSIRMTTAFWVGYVNLLANPEKLYQYGRDGVGILAELVKLVALPKDSPTRFKGKASRIKNVAWSEPIPLDEVKAVGKSLACSVNDVMLSAVAGALRRYLLAKGDPVDGVEVRAMVPVNMRSGADENKLGNCFGLVTLLLPVYEGNPFARVFEVRRRMSELRNSYLPPVSLALLGAMGLVPQFLQNQALGLLAAKASAVMTNVPGPREPLYLAGAKLSQMMFWVPQSGDIGMGVSILSYADMVQFGLITDHSMVPDPETITPLFKQEFESMLLALLLGRWSDAVDPAGMAAEIAAAQPPTVRTSLKVKAPAAAKKPLRPGKTPRPATKEPPQPAAPASRVPKRFRGLAE
jgi:diacylglycerol O-acyltransferase / wax synthase